MPDQRVTITALLTDKISGPLTKIQGALGAIGDRGRSIGQRLSPVFSNMAHAVAALGAGFSVLQALEKAENRVRAEQALLAALEGRVDAQKRIIASAKEISKVTETGVTDLLEQAALMKQIGISAEDIPRSLKIAEDTAAALNKPLALISREIASIGEGVSAGRFGRLVPELAGLVKEGATLEQVLDLLERRFGGVAEQIAKTPFGRATQLTNQLSGEMGRLGRVLITLKVAVLQAVVDGVRKIADLGDSGGVRLAIDGLAQLAPLAVKAAKAFALMTAAVVAFKGAIFAIGAIGDVIGILTTLAIALPELVAAALIIGSIAGVVTVLGSEIFKVADVVTSIGTTADGIDLSVASIFRQVVDGRLAVDDLFEVVRIRWVQAIALSERFFDVVKLGLASLDPAVAFLIGEDDLAAAQSRVANLFAEIGLANAMLENYLKDSAKRVLANKVSGIEAEIAAEREKADRIVDTARSIEDRLETISRRPLTLQDLTPLSEDAIRSFLNDVDEAHRDAAKSILQRELDEQLRIRQIADEKLQAGTANDEDLRKRRDAIETFLRLRNALEVDATKLEGARVASQSAAAKADLAALEERRRVIDLTLRSQREQLEEIRAQETRDGSSEGLLQTKIAVEKKILETERERTDVLGAIKDQQSDTLRLRQREQEAAFKLLGSEQAIRDARVKAAEAAVALLRKQEEGITARATSGVAAFQAGGLTREEAVARTTEAIASLNERAREAREELDRMLSAGDLGAALPEDIERLNAEISQITGKKIEIGLALREGEKERLKADFDEALKKIEDGLKAGTTSSARAVSDLNKLVADLETSTANAQSKVFDLLTTPGIEVETADKLSILKKQIQDLHDKVARDATLSLGQALVDSLETSRSKMDQSVAQVSEQLSAGLLTASDAYRKTREAKLEYVAAAEKARAAIIALAEAHPLLKDQLDQLSRKLDEIAPKLADVGPTERFFNSVKSGFTESLERASDFAEGGKRFGEALVDGFGGFIDTLARGQQSLGEFTRAFLADLAIMIAKLLAFNALKGILGGFGFAFPVPVPGVNRGGRVVPGGVIGFDEGGRVPGPLVNRDVVDAKLTPGEWVMSEPSTRYYGDAVMASILSRRIPRDSLRSLAGLTRPPMVPKRSFAEGGPVLAGGSTGRGGGREGSGRALIVADDQTLDRLTHGGSQGFLRYARRRSADIVSALGMGGLGKV